MPLSAFVAKPTIAIINAIDTDGRGRVLALAAFCLGSFILGRPLLLTVALQIARIPFSGSLRISTPPLAIYSRTW